MGNTLTAHPHTQPNKPPTVEYVAVDVALLEVTAVFFAQRLMFCFSFRVFSCTIVPQLDPRPEAGPVELATSGHGRFRDLYWGSALKTRR
jgi:hypothetical protein